MKTDLVIANFPYGAIGANLTKNVIDNIDFKEFINLLPANDYKRNTDKDLFNYQSDMVQISGGFNDAAVTTHLAKIHKTKVNNLTTNEFERSQYIDKSLNKYFIVTSERPLVAEDILSNTFDETVVKSIFIPMRLSSGDHSGEHHLPWGKKAFSYLINTNAITYNEAAKKFGHQYGYTGDANGNYWAGNAIVFKTPAEKNNVSSFMYSSNGFKFLSKVFTAMNKDGRLQFNDWFPKVDWTHSWTVEEILIDYGYTTNEIKEVMDDLVNFKGIDD